MVNKIILNDNNFIDYYAIKDSMGIQNKKHFASILFVLISFVCIAQTHSNGMPPPPSAPGDFTPPPGLPVDGALPILIIAGLFYGVKKKID